MAGLCGLGSIASGGTLYYVSTYVYDNSGNYGTPNSDNGSALTSNTFGLPGPGGPSDIVGSETETASGSLFAGGLHAQSYGSIYAVAPGAQSFTSDAAAYAGDTFNVSGSGVAGGNLYANLSLNGSFLYGDPNGPSNYSNSSFFEIYFDPVNSFDGPYTPYAAYFWGIGSDYAGGSPPNATYMGTLDPGSTIKVTVPFSLMGGASQFQVAVGLGTFIYGNGQPGFSWNANFSDTLDVSFSTDPNITLTSAGGFAGTQLTAPEPGTFGMIALAGIGMATIGRRRSFGRR